MLKPLRLHFSSVFRIGNGQRFINCLVEFINGELIVHFEKKSFKAILNGPTPSNTRSANAVSELIIAL